MAKKRQLGFGTELVLMFLGIIAFIVVIWFGVGWLFTSTEASIARAEQERRESIPLEKYTDHDFKVRIILESEFFGNRELAVGVADIRLHYNPETDVYTWGLSEEQANLIREMISKWDNIFKVARRNSSMITPQGLLPSFVSLSREGPGANDVPFVLDENKHEEKSEDVTWLVTYHIGLGGENEYGYRTEVTESGQELYITYYSPETETGKSSLQTSIPTDLVYNAVYLPFLESGEEFSTGTPQITSPQISKESGEILDNLLNSIGNRGGPGKVAEILMHPRDSHSFEIEKEFIRSLLLHLDLLAAQKDSPIMVSIIGFIDEYTVMKGYIDGHGGSASGSATGSLFGGLIHLWPIGGGLIDGNLNGSFNQEPVELSGSLSSYPVQEIRIHIYFENP